MRALLDPVACSLARVMTGVFFRSVEVSGGDRLPRGAPLLIVANHVNSLADPILLMAFVNGDRQPDDVRRHRERERLQERMPDDRAKGRR